MNLATLLAMEVTPLSKVVIQPEPRAVKSRKNTGPANDARHAAAVAKYRAVMGGEWVPTWVIESELGLGPGCALPNLHKWEKLNLVEKKSASPDGAFRRYPGYVWRFVK